MLEDSALIKSTTHSTCSGLLGRLRVEDPAAWRQFAELYAPMVYRWARQGRLQPADAEDVTQEVFRVVSSRLSVYQATDSRTSFRSWMWGITRNMLRRHYDGLQKTPPARGGSTAQHQLARVPEILEAMIPPTDRDAHKSLVYRAVQMVRNDFEETTWQAFWRTTVENEPATHVGRDLAMTAKAVRQAKYRVLCRVRSELMQ